MPSMAVFCSSRTSWLPGMLPTYFINDFEMVPVAPVIIIIIIDLITLLGVCVLGNLFLSKTVGGVGFSYGKEIHPIP